MSKALVGFDLFKQEMHNNQSTLTIIKSLEQNRFSLQQLLELIYTTPNNQNKSLLILYFIDELKKDGVLYSTFQKKLFKSVQDNPLLRAEHQEDCLMFAIYCSLNGSCKRGLYLTYINRLTTQLMDQYYPFSIQTLKGLTLLWFRGDLDPLLSERLVTILFSQRRLVDRSLFAQILQSIGRREGVSNYQTIILLCQNALNRLDPHINQPLISCLQTAIDEAQLELELSQNTGFFSKLIGHFRRCYAYGWTGFFTPNPPTYINFVEEELPVNAPVYPNTIIDFYSVAHFELLVEVTLEHLKEPEEPKKNSFHLLEMLLVNDFYETIQDLLPQDFQEEIALAAKFETQDEKKPALLVELDEDSPFYGLIDSPAIQQAEKVQEKEVQIPQTTLVESAKDFVNSAVNYTEKFVDDLKVLDDINAAANYAGQLYNGLGDVSGWTKNMFFSLAKPVVCTVNKSVTEKLPSEIEGPGSWL